MAKEQENERLTERLEELTEIVGALRSILGSKHWTVLQKQIFDVELEKAKKSLAKENDTTEVFRLQGKIRGNSIVKLENYLEKFEHELQAIKYKLNG